MVCFPIPTTWFVKKLRHATYYCRLDSSDIVKLSFSLGRNTFTFQEYMVMEINTLVRIDIHLFAIFICIILLSDIYRQRMYRQAASQIFLILLILCGINTGLEAISWALRETFSQQFNFIFNTVYFALTPWPQFFWSLYVEKQLEEKKETLLCRLPKLLIPVCLAELAIISNIFFPFAFDVDTAGRYYRVWGYPLLMVTCYFLFAYTLFRVLAGRKQLGPRLFWPLVFFHLPPLLGGLLQCLLYGTSFIWPGAILALVIGYIHIQNKRLSTDYLTGAYNRLELDRYINGKVQRAEVAAFWGILVDIDHFKKINDTYGHITGDEVLIQTVKLLQKAISPRDFLARYGGDEFLIIVNTDKEQQILHTLQQIEAQVSEFNKRNNYSFQLSLSLGYGLYDTAQNMDATAFLRYIDNNMYKHKRTKR